MSIVDTIIKKRDGGKLSEKEITDFVLAVRDDQIKDYQTSALLMAIFFQGMDNEEISILTREMAKSGDVISFPEIQEPIVDKHSSGGVGDTTSLVLAPIVAANGLPVAKMSGRGLGFTGGTLDKLESIPGLTTSLTEEEFRECVRKDGIAIVGQTGNMAPVDKKLYALRDVTGTVDAIPLIASSIMSKKLADGSDAIVLDVKCGSGAFMKTEERAIELARIMVAIGNNNGKKTLALVTDMNQPLGRAVGNNLEVKEAIQALKGEGAEDFLKECYSMAAAMLVAGDKAETMEEAGRLVQQVIQDGSALEKFKAMVKNQGGDLAYIDNPSLFPQASFHLEGRADRDGIIQAINAEEIGKSSNLLGAGRLTMDDKIDPSVGLLIEKKIGDEVKAGDILFEVEANDLEKGKEAVEKSKAAFTIGREAVKRYNDPLIAIVTADGVEELRK